MRRSISESKVDKNARNEERAQKARSVHFDGKSGELRPISIIGSEKQVKNGVNGSSSLTKPLETNLDDLPPPPGKRKVIVAQRPHNFIWNLKVRLFAFVAFCSNVNGLGEKHTCCTWPSTLGQRWAEGRQTLGTLDIRDVRTSDFRPQGCQTLGMLDLRDVRPSGRQTFGRLNIN